MDLIVTLVVAPLLACFVSNRRIVYGVIVAAWAATLAPTTHTVLLDDQVDKRSMANTLNFFAVNYVVLGVGNGIAYTVLRRRTRRTKTLPGGVVASR